MACASAVAALAFSARDAADKGLSRSDSGNDLQCSAARGGAMTVPRSASDPVLLLRCSHDSPTKKPPSPAAALRNSRSVRIFPSVHPIKLPEGQPDRGNRQMLGHDHVPAAHRTFVPLKHPTGGLQDIHTDATAQHHRVHRILQLSRQWRDRQNKDAHIHGQCQVSYDDDDHDADHTQPFHVASFASLLSHVPLHTAELFSKLAFLCNRAYTIPDLKPEELTTHRLHWVTSSLQTNSHPPLHADSTRLPPLPPPSRPTRPSIAYRIAASAKGLLSLAAAPASQHHQSAHATPLPSSRSSTPYQPQAAACMPASTITAVVAVEENAKQEAARDLRSPHLSPCDWYVCDHHASCTRYFVIQGSDSLASWQANLFFEPTNFEQTGTLVHRGIYEAAKGIYDQFRPLVDAHLHRYGDRAKFQFTGHSLGGSLSMLINLMLLGRGVLQTHMLLPVVTFGSPFVFCGGRGVLDQLGLDEGHVRTVIMHRDIVPRAFACTYPNQVSQILKRLCGTFKSHPCLNYEKLLYAPFGRVFILQPDESSSPSHPFLPSGSGLYTLDTKKASRSELMMALRAFLNCPHPLETLSDPTAYGSEGTILRDHDSGNYLGAVNTVLERERKQSVVMKGILKKPNGRVQHISHLRLLPDKLCCDHHRRSHQGRELDVELVGKELVVGI